MNSMADMCPYVRYQHVLKLYVLRDTRNTKQAESMNIIPAVIRVTLWIILQTWQKIPNFPFTI